MEKEIFAAIGVLCMLTSYGIYLYSIYKGKTKPHPFSWFIWASLTGVIFFAQVYDGGGIGTIITGLSGIVSLGIAGLAFFLQNEITISKSDKIIFVISLLSIPLWLITDTPLWSVILVTFINMGGFYPTYRKSWHNPEQESCLSYAIGGIKHIFTLLALENLSIITALTPASVVIVTSGLLILIAYRRWVLKNV